MIELDGKNEKQVQKSAIALSKKNKGKYVVVYVDFGQAYARLESKLNRFSPSDSTFKWYVLNGQVKKFSDKQWEKDSMETPTMEQRNITELNSDRERLMRAAGLNPTPIVMTEAKHPNNSIYGFIGKLWTVIQKTIDKDMKHSSKITFKSVSTVATGIWIVDFEGHTVSDVEFKGYLTFSNYTNKPQWFIGINFNHTMRGEFKQTIEFNPWEDVKDVCKTAALVLDNWISN